VEVETAVSTTDPLRLVVVEESPEFEGELLWQAADAQTFLARYREWISRYMCTNELFMLREFVKELEKDGMIVCFAPSTKPILDNYERWERPLEIEGFTCPSMDDGPGKLHPFQVFTLNRALDRATNKDAQDRLMFAGWGAGSGKSLFACAGAQELFNRGQIDVCIVLAYPMVMKPNLAYAAKASFDKTTKLDWCMPEGTKKQREAEYAAGHQVVIINYERCWADFAALKELTEGRCVLWVMDEVQKVLTHETDFRKITKTRKHLNRLVLGCEATVWPMSASVVSHNPLRYRDVFNLAGNDNNNPLGAVTAFEKRYASSVRHVPIGYNNEITYWTWNVARLHEVRHRVARKTQSVRKTDPGVREFFKGNQVIQIPVQMSKEDRRLYDWVLDRAWDANKEGEPLMGHYRLLRYICNTPLALQASADPLAQELVAEHPKLITSANCAKLEMFLDQVESIAEQEDKVIAFTAWTNLGLLLLAPEVEKRGINHVLHYGVGQRAAESQAAQHIFKIDPAITLFFSSDAGAQGLSLPEARYCINYEVPYSYDLLMQRSERNNRADSQFDTTTYLYITDNTIEERIFEINEERRKLAQATLGTVETLTYSGGRGCRSEEANLKFLMFGEDK
jgi:hypothetical protein